MNMDFKEYLIEGKHTADYVKAMQMIAKGFDMLNSVMEKDYDENEDDAAWESISPKFRKEFQQAFPMSVDETAYSANSLASDAKKELK